MLALPRLRKSSRHLQSSLQGRPFDWTRLLHTAARIPTQYAPFLFQNNYHGQCPRLNKSIWSLGTSDKGVMAPATVPHLQCIAVSGMIMVVSWHTVQDLDSEKCRARLQERSAADQLCYIGRSNELTSF